MHRGCKRPYGNKSVARKLSSCIAGFRDSYKHDASRKALSWIFACAEYAALLCRNHTAGRSTRIRNEPSHRTADDQALERFAAWKWGWRRETTTGRFRPELRAQVGSLRLMGASVDC